MKITAVLTSVEPLHGWLYDWQTLITGVLAVFAAAVAATVAWRQLRAAQDQLSFSRDQATRDRAGRLRAARASLPSTLSVLCEYATQMARVLLEAWPDEAKMYPDGINPFHKYIFSFEVPAFPSDALSSLERVVELTDENAVADRIESILREAQVLAVRAQHTGAGEPTTLTYLAEQLEQTASIYARAESLFEYARRQSEGLAKVELWERVFAAFTLMGVQHELVLRVARQNRDGGLSPGEADTVGKY